MSLEHVRREARRAKPAATWSLTMEKERWRRQVQRGPTIKILGGVTKKKQAEHQIECSLVWGEPKLAHAMQNTFSGKWLGTLEKLRRNRTVRFRFMQAPKVEGRFGVLKLGGLKYAGGGLKIVGVSPKWLECLLAYRKKSASLCFPFPIQRGHTKRAL